MIEFITTNERQEIARREAEQHEHERVEKLLKQNNAAALAEQQKREQAAWAKQNAVEEEETLARNAKSLRQQITNDQQQLDGLRRRLAGEVEVVPLREEAGGLVAALATRPLAATMNDPRELDRLARLNLLLSLWPERKKVLAANVTKIERELERAKTELAAMEKLFPKLQAAAAKFFKRGDA